MSDCLHPYARPFSLTDQTLWCLSCGEFLHDACPECWTTTCHRTKKNPYCSATVYKEEA
jgi:hypothetical protein